MSDAANPASAPVSLTRRLSRKLSLSFAKGRRAAASRTPSPPALSSSPTDDYFHPSQMVPPIPTIALTRAESRTRQTLSASPRINAPAHASETQGAPLRRKSTRRARREEHEDQSYQAEWREREKAAAGFFDAQQTIVPDTTSMHSTPALAHTVQPSSLSTFAVRGPLVSRQHSVKA